jgi:phospholipid transport system substrate-binding protein
MLVVISPLLSGVARAAPGEGAQSFIRSKESEVVALLHKPEGPERDKQIARVLDSMLDYDLLAKRAMEKHWDQLSAAQKKEFTGLLKQLVQRSYERNIKGILDWDLEYLAEAPAALGVSVRTRATSKSNTRSEPVSIDYQIVEEGGTFRVYDIVTEGSSLVNNYRNQFNRIMASNGYDALIRRMKDKIRKGGEAHAQ